LCSSWEKGGEEATLGEETFRVGEEKELKDTSPVKEGEERELWEYAKGGIHVNRGT